LHGSSEAYIAADNRGIKAMSRMSNLLSSLSVGFKTARFNQALNRMSDRQLADIGIDRFDIPRRAREMASRG
jgi:uncharacterized protein YjiS (DUF1127 family)